MNALRTFYDRRDSTCYTYSQPTHETAHQNRTPLLDEYGHAYTDFDYHEAGYYKTQGGTYARYSPAKR